MNLKCKVTQRIDFSDTEWYLFRSWYTDRLSMSFGGEWKIKNDKLNVTHNGGRNLSTAEKRLKVFTGGCDES